MGNFDRTWRFDSILKMDTTIWLSVLLAVITFATPALTSEPRVVCYYTNWSVYRPGTARFNPQNINPYLCTHLVYAFGGFTKDNTLKPFDKYQDIEKGGYAKFTGLKTYNRNLKTLLAIGGWNEGSTRFSPMVASRDKRKEFVRNAIKFLRQNRFDGLDLDWEYPAFRDGGKPKDRDNYARLVKELREEFERESEKTGKPRLLLTMAVPAGIEYIQKGFDVKTLNQYLDWMNLLTYDYHSAFEPAVNHHAPLYPLEEPNEYSVDSELNIDYTIKFYLENGADRNKLVLGIPTYGRSYTLFNPDAIEIGSPADGPGEQGDATREKGYLAYYEICESLKPKERKRRLASEEYSDEESEEEEESWTVMHPNSQAMGPVAFKGNQWVGYDDVDIVKKKAEYVVENGLGGIMFWSIDNDDFRGNCHGKPYPLIEAAKEAYIQKLGSSDNTIVTDKPSSGSKSSGRRRNRPKSTPTTTTTTPKPSTAAKSNKRKSAATSTTPAWNIITPEPPTTPDPGSDFKCVDEGFYPHPRDCKKYFWCLDSGPSNLGIVAHQFTCPSGLFFNKAADSCDFSRNVLCKVATTTTKAPTTKTTATTITTTTTTTRKPIKLSTRNSILFRTSTTTTTPEPETEEEYEDDIPDDSADVDAEDPRVIKELIDLIKKVGGVEQLEKQLHLSESSASTDGAATTAPALSKKLYQKVLERTRGRNKFGSNSIIQSSSANSRRGPQNAGLEATADKDRLLRKDRPQYTTINRQRPSTTSTTQEPLDSDEIDDEEEEEVKPVLQRSRTQVVESEVPVGTTAKPLQYVNIRRARPTTLATTDTADDTASRNALFERSEQPYLPVSDTSNSLDIASARRENVPEYVTIRRQRPTTAETTTEQYQISEQELRSQETVLEREISTQPQYTSIVRARSTTTPTPEEPSSPEPTTVLAVQISSLLNSPSFTEVESPEPETTSAQTTEAAEPTTVSTTTTTTTLAPTTTTIASSLPTRRSILRRRGSTTTTTTATPTVSSSTQVSERNYAFVRRRRPLARPNEIVSDSEENTELTRKIRSTTPDSREVEGAKVDGETNQSKRFRSRFRISRTDDSVPAAATPVERGPIKADVSSDELLSLTPIDVEPQFVPRQSFSQRSERRFRSRTSTTSADVPIDSEASAATVEARRPILPRGRNRFSLGSTTEASFQSVASTQRRPTFARFTPRPFTRSTAAPTTPVELADNFEDNEQEVTQRARVTQRNPVRLPFGRARPTFSTAAPLILARKLPFTSRQTTTPQTLTSEYDEDEPEIKGDDISLSESAIEEKEHDEDLDEVEETPKRRIIIKKFRPNTGTEDIISTESIPIDESGKRRFRVIRRRPTSTTAIAEDVETTTVASTSLPAQRIRKIIRKKIIPVTLEPEITTKSVSSLDTAFIDTNNEPVVNYGEKRLVVSSTTAATTTTESIPEEITEFTRTLSKLDIGSQEGKVTLKQEPEIVTEPIKIEEKLIEETTILPTSIVDLKNEKVEEKDVKPEVEAETETKPEVVLEVSQIAIDLSENKQTSSDELLVTETVESQAETTTTSTTLLTSPSSRTRLPYRPPKRIFTSTTESSVLSSSRFFSRKFNPGVYTSPSTVDKPNVFRPSGARRPPYSSKIFTRKPFTTARTTQKIEDEEQEYSDEEILEEEPENPFVLLPPNQLFTRKPNDDEQYDNEDDLDTEEYVEEENSEEEQPENSFSSTTRKSPFRPRVINSNTFRTSTSTTEIPKRLFGSSQNRSAVVFNRFASNKPVNDTNKKRVQNVPVGYNFPIGAAKPSIDITLKNETQESVDKETEIATTTDTLTTENEATTETDDDYLSMTESITTLSDITNTASDTSSTHTVESETETITMEVDNSTDDYLENTELTTDYPTTQDVTTNAQTETEIITIVLNSINSTISSTEVTTESKPEITTTPVPVTPIVKTQYNKLFSVSRVVEVSSKQDKHRVNKNNESTLIEEGKIKVEKKPMVDKIGEVSRFSLIKIFEDEIPIYLTKLGHVYPVENPPDNPIRIDEARNARALGIFAEGPKENLVASESINEAYRHVKKLTGSSKDDESMDHVEHVPSDDFLSYINEDKKVDIAQDDQLLSQWQFIPAAYDTEKSKLNKDMFQIVTPRSMLTNPSTLPLEALFKTENPMMARKVSDDRSQPFVVYSASLPSHKEDANIVKLEVLKPEVGRSIITFAKGQEFSGGSIIEEATVKYPINISVLPQTSEASTTNSTTTTMTTTESITMSPIIEMLSTTQASTMATESTTVSTTDAPSTTETITEEATTVKISPLDAKRSKYGFPRRPVGILKSSNLTRVNPTPRIIKKINSTLSGTSQKLNKTSTFTPNKSRFSANRGQNVPVDIKKKPTPKPVKTFTTETPRSTTERKLYVKPIRPSFRPSFVLRKTTPTPISEDT